MQTLLSELLEIINVVNVLLLLSNESLSMSVG